MQSALTHPTALFTYSKSSGLFAGLSLEGTVLIERTDANKAFYGSVVPVRDILLGSVHHHLLMVLLLVHLLISAKDVYRPRRSRVSYMRLLSAQRVCRRMRHRILPERGMYSRISVSAQNHPFIRSRSITPTRPRCKRTPHQERAPI